MEDARNIHHETLREMTIWAPAAGARAVPVPAATGGAFDNPYRKIYNLIVI
jgi:hypothetical protein